MTDAHVVARIKKIVNISTWIEIREKYGINQQQAIKIRRGEPVTFRKRTLDRFREMFENQDKKKGGA